MSTISVNILQTTYGVTEGSDTIAVVIDTQTISVTTETQGPAGSAGLVWRGAYDNATAYIVKDTVSYL
jgi:hypothetical protein